MPTKKPSTRIAVKTLRRRPTGATRSLAPRDYVDQFVSEWDERRPDLRMSRLSPLMRVLRLSGLMEKDLAEIAKQHAITSAQFQVLAALRRHDPQPLSLSELGRIAILTSGSMTSLVDRLEERALVVRQPHPVDRRGVLLTLTDAGRAVIDAALHNRIERLHRLADTLGEPELDRVSTTLRRLLMAMETAVVDEPGEVAEADGE